MPRCKVCRNKFISKYFNQKACSNECKKTFEGTNPKKEINKVSDKRMDQEKLYKKVRFIYLDNNKLCERCNNTASEIHHKDGRTNERLYDMTNFMSVCRPCHNYIHLNPKESRKEGWLI